MLRAVCAVSLALVAVLPEVPFAGALPAQLSVPADAGLCRDDQNSRRRHHCEEREEILADSAALDVDPGQSGGIHVRGWDRSDVRLRTKIDAWARTDAQARDLAGAVRVTATSGRIRSDGPITRDNAHWSTAFYLDVPRRSSLALNARNGGISVAELSGGDVRGRTKNGSLRIDLTGQRWEDGGLDLETHNGRVQISLPRNYSAELEVGTVHGRVSIEFPVVIHAGRQRRFTATLGSGGATIRAITHNGRVAITRR